MRIPPIHSWNRLLSPVDAGRSVSHKPATATSQIRLRRTFTSGRTERGRGTSSPPTWHATSIGCNIGPSWSLGAGVPQREGRRASESDWCATGHRAGPSTARPRSCNLPNRRTPLRCIARRSFGVRMSLRGVRHGRGILLGRPSLKANGWPEIQRSKRRSRSHIAAKGPSMANGPKVLVARNNSKKCLGSSVGRAAHS